MGMRADFLYQALAHRPFSDVLQDATQLLGPMTREELRDAIVEPATALDVTFQDGLVDRILDDVGDDPGRLPLLQFALALLWAEQTSHELTHAAYERIGEVSGALVRHAGTVFGQLTEQERELAHRLFIQLVQPGTPGKETRRLAARSELTPGEWDLAQRLSMTGSSSSARTRALGSSSWTSSMRRSSTPGRSFESGWTPIAISASGRSGCGQASASGRRADETPGFLLRGGPLVVAEGWLESKW